MTITFPQGDEYLYRTAPSFSLEKRLWHAASQFRKINSVLALRQALMAQKIREWYEAL